MKPRRAVERLGSRFEGQLRFTAAWTGKVAVTVAMVCFVVVVLLNTIPDHPLRITAEAKPYLMAVIPQGWAFFTKDPREERDEVFSVTHGGLELLSFANASHGNWFGLRRTTRSMGIELVGLLRRVPQEAWEACSTLVHDCSVDLPRLPVVNSSRSHLICGPVVIHRSGPVPWAWSRSNPPPVLPSMVIGLDVDCG